MLALLNLPKIDGVGQCKRLKANANQAIKPKFCAGMKFIFQERICCCSNNTTSSINKLNNIVRKARNNFFCQMAFSFLDKIRGQTEQVGKNYCAHNNAKAKYWLNENDAY